MPNKSTKEHSTVQSLPNTKVQPLTQKKVEPLLKKDGQSLMKEKQLQASIKNTQPKVLSQSTEPREPPPNDKEEIQLPNLEDMLKDDSVDSLVVLFRCRNTVVSRNGQYSKFVNKCSDPSFPYERLVADLANQNEVLIYIYFRRIC